MAEEYPVLKADSLADGEMKQVRAGPTDVLVIKTRGEVFAVEPLCPHYKQPLAEGLVCGSNLRCGYHQSVFAIASGEVLEPPAMDGLRTYPSRVIDGQVYVDVSGYRTDRRRFIIIGGGAAGFAAARRLRERDFHGEIKILSDDAYPPYDRPILSKAFLADEPLDVPLPLKEADYYQKEKIDVRIDTRVVSVDHRNRSVLLSDGSTLPFDKLLVATGAEPAKLGVRGESLAGVTAMRTRVDAERLIERCASAKAVVIIGGSFIAMEAAAAMRQRKLEVTVVLRDAEPMGKTFGGEIGAMIRSVHEKKGVRFVRGRQVVSFEGTTEVESVKLDDGSALPCDIALVAVGVRPRTELLQTQFADRLDDDGGVRTDEHLRVVEHVFAAGDVARMAGGSRIEHWRYAEQLGELAADNMLGITRTYGDVPYFWTYQFDMGLDYVGHATVWDEIVVDGKISRQDFVACCVKDGRVVAVASCGRPQQVSAIMELMRSNAMPTPGEIRVGGFDYVAALRGIASRDP